VAVLERQALYAPAASLHDIRAHDVFHPPVSALDQDIRSHARDKVVGRVFLEDADIVDAFKSGQDRGARGLIIDRPVRAFETRDRCVGVEPQDQTVAQGAGLAEVGHMAGMQDVEAAVGEDDSQAAPFHERCPAFELVNVQELVRRPQAGRPWPVGHGCGVVPQGQGGGQDVGKSAFQGLHMSGDRGPVRPVDRPGQGRASMGRDICQGPPHQWQDMAALKADGPQQVLGLTQETDEVVRGDHGRAMVDDLVLFADPQQLSAQGIHDQTRLLYGTRIALHGEDAAFQGRASLAGLEDGL